MWPKIIAVEKISIRSSPNRFYSGQASTRMAPDRPTGLAHTKVITQLRLHANIALEEMAVGFETEQHTPVEFLVRRRME